MQGLGFSACMCICVCVCEYRETDLDGRTISSLFIFLKFKPQKKLIFKEHLYQDKLLFFSQLPPAPYFAL